MQKILFHILNYHHTHNRYETMRLVAVNSWWVLGALLQTFGHKMNTTSVTSH